MKSVHSQLRNGKVFLFSNICAISLWALMVATGNAQTFYVDRNHPSASDGNPGTLSSPWLTIQRAAQTLNAGDTVLVRNGVYNEQVLTTRDGDSSAGYIVFAAYPGEKPVVDGTGVTTGNNGVIIAHSYTKFLGFEVRNWPHAGIWMQPCGFVEIADCEVHDVQGGVSGTGVHDFLVERVIMHHFDSYGFDASPVGESNCYNGIINDCIAYTGRDRGANVDGFALGHGTQQNFVFNRCTTYDVYDGFDISSRKTTLNRCLSHDLWNGAYKIWEDEVTLVNCIGYNGAVSIVELDYDGRPGIATLINCTFYNGQSTTIWIEDSIDALHMYNCIVAGGDNIGLSFEQRNARNYQGDYNLFHNDNSARGVTVGYMDEFSIDQIAAGEWTTYCGQDSHSIAIGSDLLLFADRFNSNLHLLVNSPAVDKGTSVGAPAEDFDGRHRPEGNGYDIGAFEYSTGAVGVREKREPAPLEFRLEQNHPNPFNPFTIFDFRLPIEVHVMLRVYDVLGREVAILVDEVKQPGEYTVRWDASNRPSGVYFYRLESHGRETQSQTRRLVLIR